MNKLVQVQEIEGEGLELTAVRQVLRQSGASDGVIDACECVEIDHDRVIVLDVCPSCGDLLNPELHCERGCA